MKITKTQEKLFQYILAVVIVIGFFVILALSITTDKEVDNMLTGALVAAFSGIVGYYYGSSKSSSDKTEMMNGKGKE